MSRATRRPRTSLRRAKSGDAARLAEIDRRSFSHLGEQFEAPRIRRLIGNPRAVVLVADAERVPVGWAVGLLRETSAGTRGRVYGLAVDPEARGLGLGRALLGRLLAALRRGGATRIALEVREGNAAAISLYEAHGFVAHEPLEHYYARGVHGLRMWREG